MTDAHRRTPEKFAAGDRPLNRAIAAALEEIDRCRDCEGHGYLWRLAPARNPAPASREKVPCVACRGSGKRA